MKTKTFFILCLLSGIGLTQLSAQKGRTTHETSVWSGYYMPVISSNGVVVDYLTGTVTTYIVTHYDKSGDEWVNYHSKGHATSTDLVDDNGVVLLSGTGEEFTVKENDFKQDGSLFMEFHFNLIGNKGSHYLGIMSINTQTFEMSVVKIIIN
jgi:hypothetical protein